MKQKYIIGKEKLEEIIQARKQTKDKREDRRFQVIELRILGHSNDEIASITQASLRTVILWIKLYTQHGIDALRNKKRVGNHRNLTFEEEAELLKKFEEKAQQGQIVRVAEIKAAYVDKVGHSIGNGQIYRVLKRHNWRKVMPRSRHPKKASEEAIDASKKLTVWQPN